MVAIIVFIMMIFDSIIGSPLPANNDVFNRFSLFHDCMSKIPFENVHESCRNAERCLDVLFDEADNYLNVKAEIKAKLEVKHELDHFKQDCNQIFDMANNQLSCQLNGIKICLNKTQTKHSNEPLCKKLFILRDCLGPFELDCWNRIFASILRIITLGIWESNSCSNSNRATDAMNSSTKKTTSSLIQFSFNNTLYITSTSVTNKPNKVTNPIAQYRMFNNMKSRSLNLVKEDDVIVLNDNNSKVFSRSFNDNITNDQIVNCTNLAECNETLFHRSQSDQFNSISPVRDFSNFPQITFFTTNISNNVSNKGRNSNIISQFVFIFPLIICIMYL